MELEFKPVVAGGRQASGLLRAEPNKTCDSVFLDSFCGRTIIMYSAGEREDLWLMETERFPRPCLCAGRRT